MLNLEIMGSLARDLHAQFRVLFYLLLPVFFALSLIFAWFRNPQGSPDFVDALKRVIVASLLMAAFQEIADTILALTGGLATKIGDMQPLDAYMQMVAEKAKNYPMSPLGAVLAVDDFFMTVLSYVSYLLVYLARSLMVAVYHFTWMFLIIMSPILLLFHVFTSKITLNLFKSLIEVACWQIVWAVLATMLKALPFGNAAAADEGYLTLILLNFIIAIALFLTPFLVKSIVGGSFSAVSGSLMPLAVTTILASPTRLAGAARFLGVGREALSGPMNLRGTKGLSSQSGRSNAHVSRGEIASAVHEHRTRNQNRNSPSSTINETQKTPQRPFERDDPDKT